MSANSWEPEHHLSCAHLIQKFETKLQTRKGTRKRTKCNVRGHRHGKTFEKNTKSYHSNANYKLKRFLVNIY